MTFSICVRERYAAGGEYHWRFGVAVTTRLPGVGTLCPFAGEHGAVATQSRVNVDLGRRGIEYVEDGLAVEDALEALLNADEGRAQRQLHGVDRDGTFAFSGEDCHPWYGHVEGDNYTVAGNLLTGEAVVEATAEAYESGSPPRGIAPEGEEPATSPHGPDRPLGARLIDALAAGHAAGGDKREALHVQSAALKIRTTEAYPEEAERPLHHDLRVDATETPVADLRETYRMATEEFREAAAAYEGE
ncbi:MAG: DUF1028 domain-containing protein [Halobacteriaceae archaeon]